MNAFLISIAASAVVAIIYAFVLGQREEQIREYCKAKARGWLRQLYVHAIVQAVRGDAAVADSRLLVTLALAVLLGVSFWTSYDARTLDSELANADAKIAEVRKDLTQDLARPSREELLKQLDAVALKQGQLRPALLRFVRIERTLSYVLLLIFYLGWLFWRPYVLMRTRFAHEIARFSLRIQGLASKEELARLTEAELVVHSPDTLRCYVQIMKEVAARHGVPELTRTFELWDGGPQGEGH